MDYFRKKQWIRVAVCTVVVAAVVLFMTGVIGGQDNLVYPPPSQDATVKGFGGDVTAHVRLNDDQTVQTLTIDTPDETEGLGKRASEEAFTAQFIGKSAPFTVGEDGIEGLTGATVTTTAALKAINWAATGVEPAEAPAAETAQAPADEKADSGAADAETKPAAGEAAAAGDSQGLYGAYRATSENAFSKITVIAAAKDGRLTSVKILSEGEQDLLTDEIRKEWAQAILESGSATPDAVTGATLTISAGSVTEAVTEILNRIGAAPEAAPADEKAEAATATEESAAAEGTKPTAGAYRATSENAFSKITVIAAAKDGQLTSVKILSEGEQDLLTDEIRKEWAQAILESGSAAPDAVTGATLTVSAGSVTEAMTEILNRIGAAEAPAAAEESADSGEAKKDDLLQLITVSMGKEQDNSYVTDYLEQDPYLVNIYDGYGFAKDYGSARGHSYTLTDVEKTQRPHAKANCLTCKTPDYHKLVAEQGVGVYSMPFDEVMAQMTQPISCYTCHGDDGGNGGKLVVTHQYVNEALGENVSQINPASLSCGQCHIEYYFTPEDSETMMPYHSVEEMTPAAILAYYDALGFSDWEQPGTGTRMLKAQHPELETYLQGKHASVLSCADCHMPEVTTENGTTYHDHHVVSPLTNDTLLAKCAACHGSADVVVARVREIQAKVTGRETVTGNRLSELKDRLTAAVTEGKMSEEELDAVRKLHREAQWFFDFCYVENSEGAHNSELALSCLDTADEKITEAMALLGDGTPAAAEAPEVTEVPAATEAPAAAEAPAAEEAPDTPADGQAEAKPAVGAYRATSENAFSKITVIAAMKDGQLTSVKILSEGEQDLLTDEIRDEWARAILESGSAAPDAITGATLTVSAGSVTEAMNRILDMAAGK